jgi:hypothetical protein
MGWNIEEMEFNSWQKQKASQLPNCLWGPPSLLSNGYKGLFLQGYSSQGVKLTIHLHLVQKLKMLRVHSSIHLRGVVLN